MYDADMNEFTCKICLAEYDEEASMFPQELCEHIYHKDCLKNYIESRIAEAKFPILCPDPNCGIEISDRDLKELISEDSYRKFAAFSFKSAIENQKDISWCPTPNCEFAFVFDKDDTQLDCPTCKKKYCLNCRVEYHKGFTCDEYKIVKDPEKLDKAFTDFVVGQKFKQCPHCQYWVERSAGCDHMTCRCGKSFCYKCGGIYGSCECQQEAIRQM
jgi:hypothetical protein